jgi:hypothetical protein
LPRAMPGYGSRRKTPRRRLYASPWNAARTRGQSLSEGGNAARLIFDWQWTVGGLHELYARFRVVFGMQTHAAMNALGLADRLQEARSILRGRPDQRLAGILAAVADHLFRRQREADLEAEKQAIGDYSPTFLEAERVTDVQFPGARQPPKFAPEYLPIISLDDAVGLDEDGRRLTYHEVIADPERQKVPEITAIESIKAAVHEPRREHCSRCCGRDDTRQALRMVIAR